MSINFLIRLLYHASTSSFEIIFLSAADEALWRIPSSKLTLGDYLLKPRLQLSRDTQTLYWEDFRKSPSFTITNGNVTFSTETPIFLFPSWISTVQDPSISPRISVELSFKTNSSFGKFRPSYWVNAVLSNIWNRRETWTLLGRWRRHLSNTVWIIRKKSAAQVNVNEFSEKYGCS